MSLQVIGKICLCLLLASTHGCADGGLQDRYDRYYNVFGITFAPPPAGKSGIIGRVLMSNGEAAPWSKVELRPITAGVNQPPVTATTNPKGGFFLAGVEPAEYRVFITSPTTQGISFNITLTPDQVTEQIEIKLSEMLRIAGKARLKDEPASSGILVFSPGSPFSALTDHEGSFYLQVPAGEYTLRAERDNFIPWESDGQFQLTEDKEFDFTLEPNPWPDGKIALNAEDNFLVRGKATTLKISAVPGVRYMRLMNFQGSFDSNLINKNLNWEKVQQNLTINHETEGYRSFDVMFMDSYGKQSKPIHISYYNTHLDRSWTILHGLITKPVTIESGAKVAFISYDNGDYADDVAPVLDGAGNANDSEEEPDGIFVNSDGMEPVSTGASTTNSATTVLYGRPVFYNTVVIKSGAQLIGGADFGGTLTIEGERGNPVLWSAPASKSRSYVSVNGKSMTMKHLVANAINFSLNPRAELKAIVEDSEVLSSLLQLNGSQAFFSNQGNIELEVTRTKFVLSAVEHYCYTTDQTSPGGEDSVGIPKSSLRKSVLSMHEGIFDRSTVSMNCKNAENFQAVYNIHHNNFLETAPDAVYLYANSSDPDLPPDAAFNVEGFKDNHFRYPSRLYRAYETNGWRFGPNIDAPWPAH